MGVLQRFSTAELRPAQKDGDTLPPYLLLAKILQAYVEENKASDQIIHSGFKPKLANDLIRMADLNKYKRRQAPPGVKITPKAFGKNRVCLSRTAI